MLNQDDQSNYGLTNSSLDPNQTDVPFDASLRDGSEDRSLQDGELQQAFPEKFFTDPTGIDRYVVQEKVLFAWESPTKLPAPSLPRLGLGLVALALGAGIVLYLTGDFIVVLLITVIAIVYNIIIHRPLSHLKCQITTLGIKIDDKYYYWSQLTQFWFESRQRTPVLMVRNYYPRIEVLKFIVTEQNIDQIMTTTGTYLLYKKPQSTPWRRTTEFIRSLLPFDIDFL